MTAPEKADLEEAGQEVNMEPVTAEAGALGPYQGLAMVVSPAEARKRLEQLQAFVKSTMVPEIDYGVIPGTGGKDPKPTLLQPGAQKLAEIYGFSVAFEDVETVQDWLAGFFLFRKRAVLTSRSDGRFIGDGVGSCNSKESRYAYRWVNEREVPKHLDPATLLRRTRDTRNGPWVQVRIPNDEVFDLVNTIEKMACKRALIHAVIGATRSSGIFTQDLEDIPPEAFGVPLDVAYEPVAEAPAKTKGRARKVEPAADDPFGDDDRAGDPITTPQRRDLFLLAKGRAWEYGIPPEEAAERILLPILEAYGIQRTSEITVGLLKKIVARVNAWEPPAKEGSR